jgi:hypothetical protein
MESTKIWLSQHAAIRMAQRNVTENDLFPVIRFGRLTHAAGAEFYFLGKRNIPENLQRKLERLVGVTVVARDGQIITVYRNRLAPGKIRRKLKRFIESRII